MSFSSFKVFLCPLISICVRPFENCPALVLWSSDIHALAKAPFVATLGVSGKTGVWDALPKKGTGNWEEESASLGSRSSDLQLLQRRGRERKSRLLSTFISTFGISGFSCALCISLSWSLYSLLLIATIAVVERRGNIVCFRSCSIESQSEAEADENQVCFFCPQRELFSFMRFSAFRLLHRFLNLLKTLISGVVGVIDTEITVFGLVEHSILFHVGVVDQ